MLPHPLGVQPLGNQLLFGTATPCRRAGGLGDLALLSDEMLLLLLQHLSPTSLATLGCASKACYAFCASEELWKSATLEAWGGDVRFTHSWRATYRAQCGLPGAPDAPPARVSCAGVYSDLLFAPHRCAHVPLAPHWLGGDDVPRVCGLSVAAFERLYQTPNQPVIITDAVPSWPAATRWLPDALLAEHGQLPVHAGGFTFALRDYLQYADACGGPETAEDVPLYVFDSACLLQGPLAQDFQPPSYFAPDRDFFSLLAADGHPGGRPNHCWLILGPERSGSAWHVDPNATSAWNAVVCGSKKWILWPPGSPPPGVVASPDGAHVAQPSSLVDWYLNFYDALEHGAARGRGSKRHVECTLRPGELLFVPSRWWHCVLNCGPGVTVAVTQNVCNTGNLGAVLRHLEGGNPDLVSGLAEEHRASLGARLVACLEEHQPEALVRARGGGEEVGRSAGVGQASAGSAKARFAADDSARTFAFNF